MRRIFTTEQFYADGHTRNDLRRQASDRKIQRLARNVYIEGDGAPSSFDFALARMLTCKVPAWGTVAGRLHGLDSMKYFEHALPQRHQTELLDLTIVEAHGHRCTSPLQTVIDIAYLVDDLVWEQVLESGLHKKQFTIPDIDALLPKIRSSRRHGSPRIRRILDLRPADAPPTESLLETLMVQLARTIPGLPPPTRQLRIFTRHGTFAGRVDLCWPEFGIFIELDGQHHTGQPVYDANRQNRVTAATGWLCGRFTWTQVRLHPEATKRELMDLIAQAGRRGLLITEG